MIVKLQLHSFWQNFNEKMQTFGFCLQDLQKSSSPKLINRIDTNIPWACVIQVCSNGGATCLVHYPRKNSQRQFEHREFNSNL